MLHIRYKPGHNDGFGAQYQRIIGIYCICKAYNIKYLHSPFADIEYQGLQSLASNTNSDAFVNECNHRINIETIADFDSNVPMVEVNYDRIDIIQIMALKQKCIQENINIILNLRLPYNVTELNPDIYKFAKKLYVTKLPKNPTFTIGIHVRRGELYVVDSNRMLPNSFYIQTVQRIIRTCNECKVNYVIELYTEIPETDISVTNETVGVNGRIANPITILQNAGNIQEFDVLPNLNKYINENLLDTFDRMINCDILIGSRSSLTACASYLKQGLTVYHKFWHNMISSDVDVYDRNFDSKMRRFMSAKSTTHEIPKRIYQVWMQGNLSEYVKTNIMLLNADYEYSFFNESDCISYIRQHFDEVLLNTFNALKRPAHKCDLFRYCLLYREGGIYVDCDIQVTVPFDSMIEMSNYSNFVTALGAHSNSKFGECCNGFIITKPNNPIFLDLIKHIVDTQNPVDYGGFVKDLYNKLNAPLPFCNFTANDANCYLFKEVQSHGKYYIINVVNQNIMNTNGHNYIPSY
jgi:hypothetical protein